MSTYPQGLPTSDALAEAQPNSMQELFSRNPEYLDDRSIDQIVLHMRDLRIRLEASATPLRHTRIRDDAKPRTSTGSSRGKKVMDFDEIDWEQEIKS